jgi:enterochelin esterase-like enzyme
MTEVRTESSLTAICLTQHLFHSEYLEREVIIDVYLPLQYQPHEQLSLLLINDGQDLPKMPFDEILDGLTAEGKITPMICVAIHCGPDRKMEYGTAYAGVQKLGCIPNLFLMNCSLLSAKPVRFLLLKTSHLQGFHWAH